MEMVTNNYLPLLTIVMCCKFKIIIIKFIAINYSGTTYMANSSNNTEEFYDNGGAIALKGYNYQNAVASLIAILNYERDNFILFVETKDDIEVDIEDKHFFIQVKGQHLSLSNLLTPKKNDNGIKNCIFSKNIKKNHPNASYHIVLLGLKKDQNSVIEATEPTIFSEEYLYSSEQKIKIIQKLKDIGFSEEELNHKLPQCRIYFTPFQNKQDDATKFLMGCMCDKNIKVDARGKIILNELFSLINQKAEKIIKTPEDIEKKKIDKQSLIKLFETNETYTIKEEILKELLREKVITYPEKYNISKAFIKITTFYKYEKKVLEEQIGNIDISGELKDVFNCLFCNAKNILPNINKDIIFALLIDLYIQKLGEN